LSDRCEASAITRRGSRQHDWKLVAAAIEAPNLTTVPTAGGVRPDLS